MRIITLLTCFTWGVLVSIAGELNGVSFGYQLLVSGAGAFIISSILTPSKTEEKKEDK